jgi:hypothetical protein
VSFTAADFGFSDPLESQPNTLLAVKISALPWDGELVVTGPNSRVVGSGQFIPASEIGNLRYIPFTDLNGSPLTSIEFQVQDSGGTLHGGQDLDPTPNTITINVTAVNDRPRFTVGPDLETTDESGPQTIAGWFQLLVPGPANEHSQHLELIVQANSDPTLLAAGPAITADGRLTFTPRPNASGVAQITMVLRDDGGTANGGMDVSSSQTFRISVAKPHPWHNSENRFDVVRDNHVVAADVLEIVNYLNAFGSNAVLPMRPPTLPYLDVNGDNFISPADALEVINQINAFSSQGEGERTSDVVSSDPQLLDLLACDVALQTARPRAGRRSQ